MTLGEIHYTDKSVTISEGERPPKYCVIVLWAVIYRQKVKRN